MREPGGDRLVGVGERSGTGRALPGYGVPFYQRFGRVDSMAQILDHGARERLRDPRFFEKFRTHTGLLCDWIITFVSVYGLPGKTL